MFYGTGGFAYGGGSRHFDNFDSLNGWDWNGNGGSNTRTGWTLGAGVEYAITNNITIKGEYLILQPREASEQRDCRQSARQLNLAGHLRFG